MSGQPVCPECATPVEVDWEWCHGCGFDPEGKLAEARASGHEPLLSAAPSAAASGAVSGSAFPGAAVPAPSGDRPLPPPPPPPAPPTGDAPSETLGTAFPTSWDASALADPLPGAPTSGLLASPPPTEIAEHEAPAEPPSSFLDDVPTPAETARAAGAADDEPAPARPGFSPTGWQNDPPPAPPVGALDPKAGGLKTPVLIVLGVVVVLVVGFVFVKMGSNDRARTNDASSLPPPPAAQTLNTTPSTLPPTTVAAGWVEYRAPNGSYIAGFPIAPQQRNVFVSLGNRTLAAVEVNAQEGPAAPAFAVNTIDIPGDFPIADAQAAFDLLKPHVEVSGSEPYAVNGIEGIRFTGRSRGADLTGLVIVRGPRLYYLAAVGADPVAFDTFASSFQLSAR